MDKIQLDIGMPEEQTSQRKPGHSEDTIINPSKSSIPNQDTNASAALALGLDNTAHKTSAPTQPEANPFQGLESHASDYVNMPNGRETETALAPGSAQFQSKFKLYLGFASALMILGILYFLLESGPDNNLDLFETVPSQPNQTQITQAEEGNGLLVPVEPPQAKEQPAAEAEATVEGTTTPVDADPGTPMTNLLTEITDSLAQRPDASAPETSASDESVAERPIDFLERYMSPYLYQKFVALDSITEDRPADAEEVLLLALEERSFWLNMKALFICNDLGIAVGPERLQQIFARATPRLQNNYLKRFQNKTLQPYEVATLQQIETYLAPRARNRAALILNQTPVL